MWLKNLPRMQVILLLLGLMIPVLFSGIVNYNTTKDIYLQEKQKKLMSYAILLDECLHTDYETILADAGQRQDKKMSIDFLNRQLQPYANLVAASSAGVAAGYYSFEIDAVLAYGPGEKYGDKIGGYLLPNRLSAIAVREGKDFFVEEKGMRGDIFLAVHPLFRNGRIIGFTWANERGEDVAAELAAVAKRVAFLTAISAIACSVVALAFIDLVMSKDREPELPDE